MAPLNFFDSAFLEDPYPAYHQLRAEDPVHRHPLGFYVLTRYDDVAAFLRDPRFGKSGYQALFEARFGSRFLNSSRLGKGEPARLPASACASASVRPDTTATRTSGGARLTFTGVRRGSAVVNLRS